jgi:hypothetical protein
VHRRLIASFVLLAAAAEATPKDDILAVDRAFAASSTANDAHAAFLAYVTDDVRLFDGALGWNRGIWVFITAKDDKRLTGYYVTAWRRQSDDTYKACLDIGGA